MERFYEAMILINPDLDSEGVERVIEDIKKVVSSLGGEILKVEPWGLRDLAYPIKRKKKAHYFLLYIKSSGNFVKEYERVLELKEDVLRYLTLRLEKANLEQEGKETCSTSTG